ncbi:MAG: RluA family pseudouridine synthase [Candidatus Omnitrophica bacterium]|nr:RluA family pseudouridine synthase [Candidatus Omnitrophota bacterium]
MEKFEFVIPVLMTPVRADAFLAGAFGRRFSRSQVKAVFEKGAVRLNGKPCKSGDRLKEGDRIAGDLPALREETLAGEDIPLRVVYEDESLLVVDKAAGMVVHPGAGNKKGTLVQALLGRGGKLSTSGGPLRPGIVHRLDKDTSGLILVAKNNPSHRALQMQFSTRSLSKTYTALVLGRVEFEEGHIGLPIGRDPRQRKKMAIRADELGKEALTYYKVLRRFPAATLLQLKIVTGRTHQIRVHLAHLGHPVVGDAVYGRPLAFPASRLGLHASKIEFLHPQSGKMTAFESPLPPEMKDLIQRAALEGKKA